MQSATEPIQELREVCKAIQPFASRWHQATATQIGRDYDRSVHKFSLGETGFFELIEQGNELDRILNAAIEKADAFGQ